MMMMMWLLLIIFRHLAKYTWLVCNSCFLFILKMFTYVQLSLYVDINMKSKKKQNKNKDTCLELAYGILASQALKSCRKILYALALHASFYYGMLFP